MPPMPPLDEDFEDDPAAFENIPSDDTRGLEPEFTPEQPGEDLGEGYPEEEVDLTGVEEPEGDLGMGMDMMPPGPPMPMGDPGMMLPEPLPEPIEPESAPATSISTFPLATPPPQPSEEEELLAMGLMSRGGGSGQGGY